MGGDYLESAQKALYVQKVNLVNSSVFTDENTEIEEYERDNADIQSFDYVMNVHEIEKEIEESSKQFFKYKIIYSLGVRLVEKQSTDTEEGEASEPKTIIQIEAEFAAIYFAMRKLREEEIMAFCQSNVCFNVWPYWREFVQATCCRMGLSSPIEIPFRKFPKKESNTNKTEKIEKDS